MIYSAGGNCPVCFGSSDLIFLKNVISNKVFLSCYSCGCAWDHLPEILESIDSPLDFAPEGFSLATLEDIESAGFASLIVEEFSEDDLLFDGDEGFIPPERNPKNYDGKTIVITLASPLENGEKEWGELFGKLTFKNDKLVLNIDSLPEQFEIKEEWLCRIKPMYKEMSPPYSKFDLSLSLARRAFPNDTPPLKVMEIAKKTFNRQNKQN